MDQELEQLKAKVEIQDKEKRITFLLFFSSIFTISMLYIEEMQFFELDIIDYWLNLSLIILPMLLSMLNTLIFMFPVIFYRFKNPRIELDYVYIIKKQTEPLTLKYKIRKILLVIFPIFNIILIIANIALFVIEWIL